MVSENSIFPTPRKSCLYKGQVSYFHRLYSELGEERGSATGRAAGIPCSGPPTVSRSWGLTRARDRWHRALSAELLVADSSFSVKSRSWLLFAFL